MLSFSCDGRNVL